MAKWLWLRGKCCLRVPFDAASLSQAASASVYKTTELKQDLVTPDLVLCGNAEFPNRDTNKQTRTDKVVGAFSVGFSCLEILGDMLCCWMAVQEHENCFRLRVTGTTMIWLVDVTW